MRSLGIILSVVMMGVFATGCSVSSKEEFVTAVQDGTKQACLTGKDLKQAYVDLQTAGAVQGKPAYDSAFEAMDSTCDTIADLRAGTAVIQLGVLYVRLKPIIRQLQTEVSRA